MRTDRIAWLIALVAGLSSGVIAGTQQEVTPYAVTAIALVLAVSTLVIAWILPRDVELEAGEPIA